MVETPESIHSGSDTLRIILYDFNLLYFEILKYFN